MSAICGAWNWTHTCRLEVDHVGDHECHFCGDVWNRGEWDDDPDEWDRPDERCELWVARE